MLVDNGFTAAHDWRERTNLAAARLEAAGARRSRRRRRCDRRRAGRNHCREPRRRPRAAAILRAAAMSCPTGRRMGIRYGGSWRRHPRRKSSGSATASPEPTARLSSQRCRNWVTGNRVTILKTERAGALALAGTQNAGGQLSAQSRARRTERARQRHDLRALDLKNLPLADARFAFAPNATETSVGVRCPDRDPQRHRADRNPRRELGRRRQPPRRARQAPARRPRLRRHHRSGAAAPVAGLLYRARAGALCGNPHRARRRGGCGEPACWTSRCRSSSSPMWAASIARRSPR